MKNHADDIQRCPICDEAFKADDNCATDIEMGTCHFECLDGSPVVDLETGEEILDDDMHSFTYSETMDPPPVPNVEPTISAIMEQAQVFASTYSLVGGRFDDGSKMAQSNEEKADLEQMIRAALKPETFHEE